jgi:hypothetical protein
MIIGFRRIVVSLTFIRPPVVKRRNDPDREN